MRFYSWSRRAFTVGELVVVVALILILAIVLFPLFDRRHRIPERSACQSNLKQIGLGFAQYTQDTNGKFPLWRQGSNPSQGWAVSVQPYLKSLQIYQCPTETTGPNVDPGSSGYCDYFYNVNLGPQKGPRKIEALDNATETILLGDAASFSSDNISNGGTINQSSPAVDGRKKGVAVAQGQWDPIVAGSRHVEGGNYCFADGHVKWHKPKRITREPTSSPRSQPTFRWSAKNPPVSGS